MFNLSGSEIIVILLLALVVLGPDKLPDAMRKAGKTFAELKKMSSGFQDEVRKGFAEPVTEVRKTAAAVKSAAKFPTIDTTSTASDDKPRYNPSIDPPPAMADGESVAEPLAVEVVEPAVEVVEPAVEVVEPDGSTGADGAAVPAEPSTEAESAT